MNNDSYGLVAVGTMAEELLRGRLARRRRLRVLVIMVLAVTLLGAAAWVLGAFSQAGV